jgi:hypothetical protein
MILAYWNYVTLIHMENRSLVLFLLDLTLYWLQDPLLLPLSEVEFLIFGWLSFLDDLGLALLL